MTAPANTVASTSGSFGCCIAIAMPGRALPAAQPQTEFTTSISVPLVFFTASSTACGVLNSCAPIAVISPRIGAINISGYAMKSTPVFCKPPTANRLLLHHGIPLGLELISRLPLRQPIGVGDAVADRHQQLRVFRGAAQVPVGFH